MKISRFLVSPLFMGILFIVFAASMAAATFIENDFGSPAAYNYVYDSRWFELILLLLAVNLTGQMIIFKLYRKSKLSVFLFHISFVLILAGAGITRYTGWEGTIHIREGEEQNNCFSGEKFIGYAVKDKTGNLLSQSSQKYYMSTASAGNFKKRIRLDDIEYELVLDRILPNASEVVTESADGGPVISVDFNGVSIGLNPDVDCDITVYTDSVSFRIRSELPFDVTDMMTQDMQSVNPGGFAEAKPMKIIKAKGLSIVFSDMELSGALKTITIDRNLEVTGKNAFVFNLLKENETVASIKLWDNEYEYQSYGFAEFDDKIVEVKYGSEEISLPFSLRLSDFVLDRYPGSNSPSGYKSNVVLIDKTSDLEKPFTIFMNNILKHKGYRFYQSSYDPDEQGTILSVNHDPAGIMITYSGYGLLFLFIIVSLLNKESVFNRVNAGYWHSALRKRSAVLIFLLLLPCIETVNAQKLVADRAAAVEFGNILVQDQKGRTKPLFTLSSDILRKVSGGKSFEGLTPIQVFLGVYLDFENWKDVPVIKISNNELKKSLGIRGNRAAFTDLVSLEGGGSYKLSEEVSEAYSKAPGARTRTDKEIMKVDERINILYMIYTGDFLKIFPLRDSLHNWASPDEALRAAVNKEDSLYLKNIIPLLAGSLHTGNITRAKQIASSVKDYQKRFSGYDLPPEPRLKAEYLYYKLMIFERLFPFYATVGLLMLIGLIIMVLMGRKDISMFIRMLSWILFAGFVLHTTGLGIRWYISGHSPMSNGYESMIFISWVTLLAGFIFRRRSAFALSATSVLAGLTLMVAHLSFMDPEITNLVPVLKSYWLTLHVSVITGSYGFLGLGAVFGIISMILMSLSDNKNVERISGTLDELTVINFKTLTIGLYLLTAGTFLGAVWANESWGRYWGWDPKETWSLITIIVYSFVVHSRMIPGMKDIYTFNLLSLYAFSSVLMTYFGVNYYLSGLHSYAGGDPLPVPLFVYAAVIILVALSVAAYNKYRKWERIEAN